MPLNPSQAVEQAKIVHDFHLAEKDPLDLTRRYWVGRQRLPAVISAGHPSEVRVMERASRVNVLSLVVNSLVQGTYVDGFRSADADQDLDVWNVWQANRMDARQTAIHRATAAYGTAYAVVLPGDPVPVIRGVSPRSMTVVYGEDPDWPMWALERLRNGLWVLYDDQALYYLGRTNDASSPSWKFIETREHNIGVTPVVRYLDEDDLDFDDEVEPEVLGLGERSALTRGQIGPLMPLQDQIDLATFGLQISQHYSAFKQRYIIGWAAENEREAIKTAASTILTFDENPSDMQLGEFAQSDLDGYIKSRDSTITYVASIAQIPIHELSGNAQLVNLSAEALAAAEASKDRKIGERKTLWGEAHEQTLGLAGRIAGIEVPNDAEVRWRDTSARAFSATVDALGKLTQMLGIPPQELWERVPGATSQDVERWKAAAENGDAFSNLAQMLERQANGTAPPAAG